MIYEAVLNNGTASTLPMMQYDTNQQIHLSGVNLPASYLAEFSNTLDGTAAQISQTTATITVPDECLLSGKPVHVWIVQVGQNERTTIYEIFVPVKPRSEPEEYTPSPSEQTAIEAAISALEDTADNLTELIAPEFVQATANDAGSYTIENDNLYELPNGHVANATWGNTEKDQTTVGNELKKLKNSVRTLENTKAPAIISDVTSKYHEDTNTVTYVGNTHAWGNARYANAKNSIELVNKSGTAGRGSVTYQSYDGILELNGTATSGGDTNYNAITGLNLPAGTYKVGIDVHPGSSVLSGTKNMYFDLYYENATNYSMRKSFSVGTNNVSGTMTTTEKVVKIVVWFGVKSGNVYDDYRLFYYLLPNDAVITDTQQAVPSTGTLEYAFSSDMAKVDTLMHNSRVYAIVDTKTYVDAHTSDVNFIYVRPEDYGAYGDGSHDDSDALQACITAAQKYRSGDANICLRGFGRYKISTGVVINAREVDFYIKSIIYTGNDAAVTISAAYSKFEFGSIRAVDGGSNAAGIRILMKDRNLPENGFTGCELSCTYLRANGNCVEAVDVGNGVNFMYYDTLRFKYMVSINGNLIYIDCPINEIDVYGKQSQCPNGYALYLADAENPNYSATIRLHEFGFEGAVKNAVRGKTELIDCRFTEMMDTLRPTDLTKGHIFVFDGVSAGGIIRGKHPVDLLAFDMTNAKSFSDLMNDIKTYFDEHSGTPNWSPFYNTLNISNGVEFLRCEKCCRISNAHMTSGGNMPLMSEGSVFGYYDKIAYIPNGDIYKQISADFTVALTSENDYNYITPTTFDIDATSVTIHLDPSYCCYGIKNFKVIQHTGKTAIVYDKNGNEIFDGTNLGAGVYRFKCDMYVLDSLSITMNDGTVKYCPRSFLPAIYTGDNERWTVSKEELITV